MFDALVCSHGWEAQIDLPRSHLLWAGCSQVLRTSLGGSPGSPAGFPCPEGSHLREQQCYRDEQKGQKKAGQQDSEREPGPLEGKGDSLMKADAGRILRQRFCFLMAMVSCRNGDERWDRLQAPGASPAASVPRKASSLESLLPPSPRVAGTLGRGKRMGWLGLGDKIRFSEGRVESREMERDSVLQVQGQHVG